MRRSPPACVAAFLVALVGCGSDEETSSGGLIPAVDRTETLSPALPDAVGGRGAEAPGPKNPAEEGTASPRVLPVTTGHRVGDRWKYRFSVAGMPSTETTTTILDLDAEKAELQEVARLGDAPAESTRYTVFLRSTDIWAPDPALLRSRGSETIEVTGLALDCEVWVAGEGEAAQVEYWYCAELPLLPLVRMRMGDSGEGDLLSLERGSE